MKVEIIIAKILLNANIPQDPYEDLGHSTKHLKVVANNRVEGSFSSVCVVSHGGISMLIHLIHIHQ